MRLKTKYLVLLIKVLLLHSRINEVKNKIPNISNLATATALTTVENRTPNVKNLVKKI